MVTFVGFSSLASCVTEGDGQAAEPTTRASPTWPIWARIVFPACEFGAVQARLETVSLRNVPFPVLWQIVTFSGAALSDFAKATPPTPAASTGTAAVTASIRVLLNGPPLVSPTVSYARSGGRHDACRVVFANP